jgi:hypothetical protein
MPSRSATIVGCVLLTACAREPAPLVLTAADPPAAVGSLAPRIEADADGSVVASWLEPVASGGHALRWARWRGDGWSAPRTAAAGADWFVNWADTPGVAPIGGLLVAHWLRKSAAGTYAYDVQLALSADDGASWRALGTPHHDGTPTEHGFVSAFASDDGFGLVWLDGRNTGDAMGHEHHGAQDAARGMTLRAARFARDGRQLDDVELDSLTCDCCPTDVALVSGSPVLVYRDRTAEETRDIYATRWEAGRWSDPVAVHADGWRMPACPVNGPAVAARGEQVIAAWFTGAREMPQVRLAWSADGGATFGAPVRVDAGRPLGRVELVVLPDGEALVLWLEQTGERSELRARRALPDGTLREPQTLAVTSAARASGFPRAAATADAVHLVWTDVGAEGARRVKAASLR